MAHLSPTSAAVLRFMTRYNPAHRVELAPGIYTHICPETDLPETVITPKGLRHVRSIAVPDALHESRERLAVAADRLADANDRLELYDTIMRVNAGNRRRQARVKR